MGVHRLSPTGEATDNITLEPQPARYNQENWLGQLPRLLAPHPTPALPPTGLGEGKRLPQHQELSLFLSAS